MQRVLVLSGNVETLRAVEAAARPDGRIVRAEGTAERCLVDRDLFASEFVIRAEREGKRVVEIPVHIAEKRPPSINLIKRVPNVHKNMAKLTYVIRVRG